MKRKSNKTKTAIPARVRKRIKRAREIKALLEQTKILYQELDDITEELVDMDLLIYNAKDFTAQVVDNFSGTNTAFRTTSVRRFELRFEEKEGKR